jgi:hypothetical protein
MPAFEGRAREAVTYLTFVDDWFITLIISHETDSLACKKRTNTTKSEPDDAT